MGGVFSYVLSWVTPDPTFDLTPDPVTGLTEKDCHVIMETWRMVTAERKDIKKHGAELFIRLFKAHPHMQSYFSAFKSRPVEELRECPQMAAHATTVMYALQAYVSSVDDPPTLAGLVTKIATSHVARGISMDDFEKLALVFADFLKSILGEDFTPEAEKAWTQLLKVHNAIYRDVHTQKGGN
ncbi:hypothetical protein EGW08_021186 [Elysia chlorotica]|uniref:Globin n=1 Tax=Elysia chlorotica TaxID=188477 RepID=A0A433SPI5_ELYCH|nr:hypothetical protein EGW08_021186 [Elysia chlorotica]